MIRNPIPGNTLTAAKPTTIITMNSKLYVGNLSFNTSEAGIRSAFEPFGALTDVYVAMDRDSGRPRGFAFVTFNSAEESQVAAEKMNGTELDGRTLTVNEAKPKEEMSRAGGNGRNFGPDRRPFKARQRY